MSNELCAGKINIDYHRKVLSGEVKIDRRRSYYFDAVKGRQKTSDEIRQESACYLRNVIGIDGSARTTWYTGMREVVEKLSGLG